MSHYAISGDWIQVSISNAKHNVGDHVMLVDLIRSTIFRRICDTYVREGTKTVLEGYIRLGAEKRLEALGIRPVKRVTFK